MMAQHTGKITNGDDRLKPVSSDLILDNLFDGVYFVDLDRRITFWNKGAERITGYSRQEVLGRACHDNLLRHIDAEGHELCLHGCPLSETMRDGSPRESDVFLHHKFGHRVPVTVRTNPVRDKKGRIIGSVEIFNDNSNAQQMLQELEKLRSEVYRDPLTGVGNRRYAEMNLETRLHEWHLHAIPFGVLFLDIDHFKNFNDTYGHKTGDEVLIMVSRTIAHTLRSMDVAARWGGEEFIVILPGVSLSTITSVAERIRKLTEHSFLMVQDSKLSVTLSLGGTLASHDDSPASIVARADMLMYNSKRNGRNMVTIEQPAV